MSRAGFTLVEVVTSLAVAGVVVLLVHAGMRTTAGLQERAAEARDAGARAAAVRRQVASWLGGAVVEGTVGSWDFEGAGGVTPEGLPDAVVTFVTLAPGPFEPGRARMSLFVDRDPATPATGLVGYRGRHFPPGDTLGAAAPPDPAAEVELAPEATGLVVRYLHTVDGVRAWTDAWRSSAQLPEAVEVRVLGDSLPPLLQAPVFVVPRGGG